ncbi:uncharacterized protein LOC124889661 [Capsicum annuum]|uniref:uncharacterized protein LOC124889661 n=1 Tax=Capsicum annuum TaxID=4072 RepID=UPI001FB18CD8|nr:uncharacterized protein LOC124889661 [Capsicum annuum]
MNQYIDTEFVYVYYSYGDWKLQMLNEEFLRNVRVLVSKANDVDEYKLWYSDSVRHTSTVGILVDEDLRGQVVEVKRANDRLMSIKLVLGGSTLNDISSYVPQARLNEEEKKSFWEVLNEVVRGIPSTKKIFVGGDFNEHIGSLSGGYNDV